MTVFKSKYQKWLTVLGILFLILYLLKDILYEKIWVLSFLLMVLFAIGFVILLISGIIKKEKSIIPIPMVIILIVSITEILKSEIFKSEKVLVAVLIDDRSEINMTLRKNNNFVIESVAIFSKEMFKGKYKISNNKIIFLDKPYDNNLIPDTVTIIKDKIILEFNRKGEPVTDFATYFEIKQNHLLK